LFTNYYYYIHFQLEANHERDPEKIYEINLYGGDLTKINNLQKVRQLLGSKRVQSIKNHWFTNKSY